MPARNRGPAGKSSSAQAAGDDLRRAAAVRRRRGTVAPRLRTRPQGRSGLLLSGPQRIRTEPLRRVARRAGKGSAGTSPVGPDQDGIGSDAGSTGSCAGGGGRTGRSRTERRRGGAFGVWAVPF